MRGFGLFCSSEHSECSALWLKRTRLAATRRDLTIDREAKRSSHRLQFDTPEWRIAPFCPSLFHCAHSSLLFVCM